MKALFLLLVGALLGIALLPHLLFRQPPMPEGTNLASPDFRFSEAELLIDRTLYDAAASRRILEHEIFDALLAEIRAAETFLVVDFFLWNPWQGAIEGSGDLRPLARELADALIRKRRADPGLPMLVLTDPINRIYGAMEPAFFREMADAGIPVVFTALDQLPDSNRVYAPQADFWKKFLPGGRAEAPTEGSLPNPFDPEGPKLRLAQYGRLLYFKANHRKILVAGRAGSPPRLIMPSLNPADGSANHSNIALLVEGPVARFAAASELAVARWSLDGPDQLPGFSAERVRAALAAIEQALGPAPGPEAFAAPGQPAVAYRSERAVRDELLLQFKQAVSGTRIDIGMFYFSDREVIGALKEAIERGARLRLLLDANRDAFGRKKNGIPNRIVAAEFMALAEQNAVEVRWAATHGEQFHSKVLRMAGPQQDILFLGSANWTRRNLGNLNLEANLLLKNTPQVSKRFDAYFDTVWSNSDGFEESLPYEAWAETGWTLRWKTWLYRFQEWSGASTF